MRRRARAPLGRLGQEEPEDNRLRGRGGAGRGRCWLAARAAPALARPSSALKTTAGRKGPVPWELAPKPRLEHGRDRGESEHEAPAELGVGEGEVADEGDHLRVRERVVRAGGAELARDEAQAAPGWRHFLGRTHRADADFNVVHDDHHRAEMLRRALRDVDGPADGGEADGGADDEAGDDELAGVEGGAGLEGADDEDDVGACGEGVEVSLCDAPGRGGGCSRRRNGRRGGEGLRRPARAPIMAERRPYQSLANPPKNPPMAAPSVVMLTTASLSQFDAATVLKLREMNCSARGGRGARGAQRGQPRHRRRWEGGTAKSWRGARTVGFNSPRLQPRTGRAIAMSEES